jgi:hypothetical protein
VVVFFVGAFFVVVFFVGAFFVVVFFVVVLNLESHQID